MKLHYKGKFNLDPECLPCRPHEPGAVKFREVTDTSALASLTGKIALAVLALCLAAMFLRHGWGSLQYIFLGYLIAALAAFPHELLHAVCFKEDVYLYTNLKQGMMFVVGPERMSKSRFICMSMLPNIVFGLLPFLAGIAAGHPLLSAAGAAALSMGAGDYYNVYNAMTQMPKGAKTYLHKFNSYWYVPSR